MKIYVKGEGEKKFTPQNIIFSLKFTKRFLSYKQAYTAGNLMVDKFLDIVKNFNYKLNDFKTSRFAIKEEFEFKDDKKYVTGYIYNRVVKYVSEYNVEHISKMFCVLDLFNSADRPSLQIEFGLNDTKEMEMQVLAEAFKNAKLQAEAIAELSGAVLKVCCKTSFEPFEQSRILSPTTYNENFKEEKIDFTNQMSLVPDITIKKEIYCGFEANYKQDE